MKKILAFAPLVAFTMLTAAYKVAGQTGNVGFGTNTPEYRVHSVSAGTAIFGNSTGVGGYGVWGQSNYLGVFGSGSSYGLYGSGGTYGLYASGTSYGVYGSSNANGVYGISTSGYGVYGKTTSGIGVVASGASGYGLYASSTSNWSIVGYGVNGVYGSGSSGYGVQGVSSSSYGVYAISPNTYAIFSNGYHGTRGDGTYAGIWGQGGSYALVGYGGTYGVWATGTSWAGYFQGNVYSTGTYQGSDKKLKKNIREFSDAMGIINRLKPRAYEFRQDGDFGQMKLPPGNHYGLIAQEVEEVLPDLVHTAHLERPSSKPLDSLNEEQNQSSESKDFKALNYTEFIPIMIKAIQELDKENKKLKAQVATLTQTINRFTNTSASTQPGTKEQRQKK